VIFSAPIVKRLLASVAVVCGLAVAAGAAPPPAAGTNQFNSHAAFLAAALSEFLSDTRNFTAGVEVTVPPVGKEPALTLPFGVAAADGKMRWELNLANVKSASFPPEVVASFKDMGLDRMFFIYLPNQPLTLVLPGAKAYIPMPIAPAAGVRQQAQEKVGRLEKRELGRETIGGQPTIKYAIKVPGDDGTATVWQATNLQNLPVKLVITKEQQSYQFLLSNIRLGAPDPRYFEIPAGLTKMAVLHEVLRAAAMRALGGVVGGLK